MPKPIGTFCNASRSQVAVKRAPYVWISEDTLSETYTTFVRNHKRHGSNVPGPLEARRRASKRRATQLAHHSATNYTPQSFELFDTRSQDGWWKKTETSSQPQANSWLWPFTFPQVARRPPPPPTPSTGEGMIETFDAAPGEKELKSMEKEIRRHLKSIRTHTESMYVLSYLSIDLRRNPQLAETVLKHMIAQLWEHEEIAEFLLDPWTNTPGTTNHVYILEHAKEHADLLSWLLQRGVFEKAARLGLLDILEIQRMLLLIPSIQIPDTPDKLTWASICSRLVTAMDESQVLTVHDLDKSFMADWLQTITKHNFCPTVPSLLWRVNRLTGLSDGEALESVVVTSISMTKGDTICHLSGLVDFLRSQPYSRVGPVLFLSTKKFLDEVGSEKSDRLSTSALERTVDNLFRKDLLQRVGGTSGAVGLDWEEKSFVRTVLHDTLRKTGEAPKAELHDPSVPRMLQRRIKDVSKLELWYAVLGNLGFTAEFQLEMDRDALKEFVQAHVEGPEAKQRLMTAAWVSMALSVRNDAFIKLSGVSEALATELRRNFLTATEAREDVLVRLLETLQSLPLPAKNKLIRRLHELSGNLMTVRQNYWDMVQVLDHLNGARVLELSNPIAYQSMKLHFSGKLREMCEAFNEDMETFERSSIDIIRHARGSMNIMFRILVHNQRLQRSLLRAGCMLQSTRPRWYRPLGAQQDLLGGRSPLQLLDMIERFAIETARSEQLSSRNAFRKVYWLMRYLVQLRVPIRSAIWKALWHARVVRQDERGAGACYYTTKWLYDKITRTDGRAEADRLLRISSMSNVLKELDGTHIVHKPHKDAQQSPGEVLGTMGIEGPGKVEILPFHTPRKTVSRDITSESKMVESLRRQDREAPTQYVEDTQSTAEAKVLHSSSLDGLSLSDPLEHELRIHSIGSVKSKTSSLLTTFEVSKVSALSLAPSTFRERKHSRRMPQDMSQARRHLKEAQ